MEFGIWCLGVKGIMARVYLGLGSNIGDRKAYLRQAIEQLEKDNQILITKVSPLYETVAVGNLNQRNFYNLVVEAKTNLSPYHLLSHCQGVEEKLARKREIKWGPRTIDIDILLYDDEEIKNETLKIPHPEMTRRAFVLRPLIDIFPEAKLPSGIPIKDFLKKVAGQKIRRLR